MLSEIFIDNEVFRYDAEYFNKEARCIIDGIKTKKHFLIEDEFDVSKLAGFEFTEYFTPQNLNSTDNYVALTSKNIQCERIELTDTISIDKTVADNYLQRSKLFKNDIVLSYTGEYRRSLVLLENNFHLGPNVCRLRPKNNKDLSFYVSSFFNSKIGQIILDREKTLSAQPTVAMSRIRKIPVPYFKEIIEKIKSIIQKNNKLQQQSLSLYREAEDLLLEAIGLKGFAPSEDGINIKTLQESFLATGRLDAEYYQKKYEEVEKQIKKLPFDIVENICSDINYGTVPTSPYAENGEGVPYIKGMNLKNLSITGELDKITNTDDLPRKFYTKEGDIIVSQMGTVGDIGVISKDEEDFLFASFTIRIRIKDKKKYNPFFVGLYIQNIAKEWYLLRNIAQASVRQNTDLPTIRNMPIPLIESATQQRIAALIASSFALRRESEQLLEDAKARVEAEIENSA